MHVALTGGMGSGKTFVLSCFRELGWVTVECDAITRELLAGDATVAAQIRAGFGNEVFDERGAIDRKKMAAVVFSNEEKLHELEEILHPLVRREWTKVINNAGDKPAIVEIPLLFEKKLEKLFNISVCVTVSEPMQIARLSMRGFTKAEALARISRQMPLREKELRADFVILNNSNTDYTRAQVTRFTQKIAFGD